MELSRLTGKEALDHIFEPCSRDGEGFLHLWLGNTRMGKTFANTHLVNAAFVRRHIDTCYTIDDKDPEKPQYDADLYRATPGHLKAYPKMLRDDDKHVSFRGHAMNCRLDEKVSYGDVARLTWDTKMSIPKIRILLNIDELARATNGKQSWLDDTNGEIYRAGAGVRISTTATTQMPQILPREAFGLSQTIGMFRTDTRELDYLIKFDILPKDIRDLVRGLDVGDFVIYKRGEGLLPHVFRF